MRNFVAVFCFVLVASLARAEENEDSLRCSDSGGISWNGTRSSPPRCVCPSGKVNAITAGGVCNAKDPQCDKCVPVGSGQRVRVVEREKVRNPSCEDICLALGEDMAHWNPEAEEDSRCAPMDAERYFAGKCGVVPKPAKLSDADELCEMACRTTANGAAYWDGKMTASERCQPNNLERFVAGACTIVPKPAEPSPLLICSTLCTESGGRFVDGSCQCPEGSVDHGNCQCQPRLPEQPPLFHLGGELRFLGLITRSGDEGLYVPLGIAPSLALRFDPWGQYGSLAVVGGPLITGNGGETEGTPLGVALMAGAYLEDPILSPLKHIGFEADFNWYAVDRHGEAYAFSLGGRFPVFRWQWRTRWGECHAGGGIGGAYLIPEEMVAFIWGFSAGCTTP